MSPIVKVCALEVPPPGAGLKTVTCAVPAVAMSEAGIEAVTWVEDTYVVVRFEPFQRTTDPDTKFVPLTVNVKAGPPAVADEGLRLVVVGTGLSGLVNRKGSGGGRTSPWCGCKNPHLGRPSHRNVRCIYRGR